MLKITPKEDVEAYFELDKASQSHTKMILQGLAKFVEYSGSEKDLYYSEKSSWVHGSAVDDILTGEDGDFEKYYHISPIEKKPSEAEMAVIHIVFDALFADGIHMETSLEACHGMIQAASEVVPWYGGKPGKRIDTLIKTYTPYFNDLKLGAGKQVLSMGEKGLVDKVVKSLREHPRTAKYFNRERLRAPKNITFYYQLKGEFMIDERECKFLADMVIVSRETPDGPIVRIQPIDLKTMAGATVDFPSSLRRWRYDIQAAWYRQGIIQHFDVDPEVVMPMMFIVESTTAPGSPAVFQLTPEVEEMAWVGKKAKVIEGVVVDRAVPGIAKALELLDYYQNHSFVEEQVLIEAKLEPIIIGKFGIIR